MTGYSIDIIWTVVLILASFWDAKEKKIPNRYVIAVSICVLLKFFCGEKTDFLEVMLGGCVSTLVFFGICMIVPGAFGGGDIKLSAVNGMYLGAGAWLKSFVISIFMAAFLILFQILRKNIKKDEEIAFGPFLCAGAVITKYFLI